MKLYGRELQSSLASYIVKAEEATKAIDPLVHELALLRGCLSSVVDVLDALKKQSEGMSVELRPLSLELSIVDKIFQYTKTIGELVEKVNKIGERNSLNPNHVLMLVQQILLILNQHIDKDVLGIVNSKLQHVLLPFSDNTVRPLPLVLESVSESE